MTEIASVLSRNPGPDDRQTIVSVLDDLTNIAELPDFETQPGDSSDLSGQHDPVPDATVASAPCAHTNPARTAQPPVTLEVVRMLYAGQTRSAGRSWLPPWLSPTVSVTSKKRNYETKCHR